MEHCFRFEYPIKMRSEILRGVGAIRTRRIGQREMNGPIGCQRGIEAEGRGRADRGVGVGKTHIIEIQVIASHFITFTPLLFKIDLTLNPPSNLNPNATLI